MVSNMQSSAGPLRQALVVDFKRYYQQANTNSLARLERLYTDDVEFRNPVQTLHGRLALRRYLSGLYQRCEMMQFEYLHEFIEEDAASISWEMTCQYRHLNRGQVFKVRGMTLIRFSDRIFYHEDCYDMGQALYRHIPLLGSALRLINRRIDS
jgi:nuclear transport factor 2 (NTF2) superfamily protein